MVDLAVVGGGPGGYMAAERAAQGGLAVVLFEEHRLGGVCLNEGCIPSKTLLHAAKTTRHANEGAPYGVAVPQPATVDHAAVLARKALVVKRLVAGVAATLRGLGVEVKNQRAVLAGQTGSGFRLLAGGEEIEARRVLVATGSVPVVPPIAGLAQALDSGFAVTSQGALELAEVPQTLCVIGGGVIGLELGCYYQAAGSQVTIVEQLPRLVATMDGEVSALMRKECEKQGMRVLTATAVQALGPGGVTVQGEDGTQQLAAQRVLLATGRCPATEGVGLETVGLLQSGPLLADAHCQTAVPGLYCAGDVNGHSMLAHTAYREAEVAVNHMLGVADVMDYRAIPTCLYTQPEAAGVGETEESAAQKGLPVEVRRLPMNFSGRYMAENNRGEGFCKLLVHRDKQTVVGAHLVGGAATEIIYAAGLMVQLAVPVQTLQKTVFPHPTVAEILREALFLRPE